MKSIFDDWSLKIEGQLDFLQEIDKQRDFSTNNQMGTSAKIMVIDEPTGNKSK